jgi:hypothetical protein
MKPSIGRIVHVTFDDEKIRPAIVVEVWSDTCVNLRLFADGPNDSIPTRTFRGYQLLTGDWLTSVEFAETPTPGRWSWPPRVE